MKVIKIGGGCLNGKKTIGAILDLLAVRGKGNIIVVSALHGITDMLIEGMKSALADDQNIPDLMSQIKHRHMLVAKYLIPSGLPLREYRQDLGRMLAQLERMFYGLNFTREITPRISDYISSFGERLSSQLLSAAMRANGVSSLYRMPHEIGIVTDGKYGDATANLVKTTRNFRQKVIPTLKTSQVLFIPGFFGVSENGEITTFGRGGSDYAAAVVTVVSGADVLEIWKDVDGFFSADPRFIESAELIPELSYDEAAELSYFGAKILHPRTVEPLRKSSLNIEIRNTMNPDVIGSRITSRRIITPSVVKSVAHTTDIGIVKVHASGVGVRPGILGDLSAAVAEGGVNIKSVVTSQTCISLLLARSDLESARNALEAVRPRRFRRLQKEEGIALVSIVGEGLARKPGIAARCFSAAAACKVNIEMIAFGPSSLALYFIVKERDLPKAVTAIHTTFFGDLGH
jgi:aspartate kinase